MKGKVDPFTLQALLGHATFAMTTGYAHATPEEMERAVTQRDDRGRNVVKLKEKAS
jgi:integrase